MGKKKKTETPLALEFLSPAALVPYAENPRVHPERQIEKLMDSIRSLHGGTVAESLRACGFGIRSQIIWAKPHFTLCRGDYHWQHECCWYAVRDGEAKPTPEEIAGYFQGYESCWYAIREKGKSHWQGSRSESTLWEIDFKEDAKTTHGTQKPMLNNSAPGDAVYEPFSGSGTSIIAAESCHRRCYAV